jgi:hypothetical protein
LVGTRKGQAAVEYLIILAVVIIIALVVVGVLGGFPSLTRGVSERESAAYWLEADVGLARYIANSSGVYAILRNNRNFNARFWNVTQFGSNTTSIVTFNGTLAPGEATTEFRFLGSLPAGSCTTAGETFSVFPVKFTYTDAQFNNNYAFVGAKTLAGICS